MTVTSWIQQRTKMSPTQLLRRLTQAGFGLFIIISSIRHNVVSSEHLVLIGVNSQPI